MTDLSKEEDQKDAAARKAKGEFVRGVSAHRHFIGQSDDFPAEPNRYHLFVALNCPWCHRVTLARNILGLRDSITMDVAFPSRTEDDDPAGPNLWQFAPGRSSPLTGEVLPECTLETATGQGFRLVQQIYQQEGSGERSVPILYDRVARRIVSNESAEIVRMLGLNARALGSTLSDDNLPTLYPVGDENEGLRQEIDALNQDIYVNINNGSYKAGFSSDQDTYTLSPRTPEDFLDVSPEWDSYREMIRSNFLTASDRKELLACVKRQREDHGIARRANALLLLDDGWSCERVGGALFLDDDTVRNWHKQYLAQDWDAVAYDGWKGGQSAMTSEQEMQLCVWLEGRFCRSAHEIQAHEIQAHEIQAHIAGEFDLHYSHSGCLKLLGRLGFEYRKPKAMPPVADESSQAQFIAMYEALLNGLQADEAVYFADAVHPEYQSKPAFGWVKKGTNPVVKTTAGRGRINIHGAVNLENFDTPFIEPTTVDGKSAAQLLAQIESRNRDKRDNRDKRIIHVIWDNAAYHRGPDVRAFLSRPDCRIRLIQLPPYCPHLNPIERLWKVMHERVTHNRYYPTQKQFADAILAFLRKTIPKEWKSFTHQVTDNFRIISNQNVRIVK